MDPILDFPTVCSYIGKLYLDSRLEIEKLAGQVKSLREQLMLKEQELVTAREAKVGS